MTTLLGSLGAVALSAVIVFTALGCGGTDAETPTKAAATHVEKASDVEVSLEEEARMVAPAVVSVTKVAVTGGGLAACVDQPCLTSRGEALAADVDRATRAVARSLTKVETACLKDSAVDFRRALRAYAKGALEAQGGQKQRMLGTLDTAADLVYAARDSLFGCSSVWPPDVQAMALDLGGLVATITAIYNVQYECQTVDCIRTQGKLMERAADKAIAAFETFDLGAQSERCQKVAELTRSLLFAYRAYARAGRDLDVARMEREYRTVNGLIAQRQQQLETCISG